MYSADVRRLYDNCMHKAQPLNEEYAIQAGVMVERLFPPTNTREAFQLLASLNLLNAVVKRQWGRRLVTYEYIKGMAAHTLLRLLVHPIDDVATYWDATERIAYFTVMGVQLSFHYIPLSAALLGRLSETCLQRQVWTGMQLQKIAVEVFSLALGGHVSYTADEEFYVRYIMLHCHAPAEGGDYLECQARPPKQHPPTPPAPPPEDWPTALDTALHFRIWEQSVFTLWRRKDQRKTGVVRYDGKNHAVLMDFLLGKESRIYRRSKGSLQKGKLYYVSPQKKVQTVNLSNYIQLVTRNSYLVTTHGYHNLCITYGIARYLGFLHPTLKFVCTLNYNHLREQRIYYTYHELVKVPIPSQARMLKVWIVVDTGGLLDDFDSTTLPQSLIDDYVDTEDYYQEFEVVCDSHGRKGLVAYRRHQILQTIYRKIVLKNYHAQVQGRNGLWAIFSLCDEQFRTGFKYEKIWYDQLNAKIMGLLTDGHEEVIYSFRLLPRGCTYQQDVAAPTAEGCGDTELRLSL